MIAYAFFPVLDEFTGFRYANPVASNLIFVAVQVLFIPTLGGSPGHRLFGMRIVRVDGGWSGLWRPVVRTLLLALIIPAVIWDGDHRGLHDKTAGTVLVPRLRLSAGAARAHASGRCPSGSAAR